MIQSFLIDYPIDGVQFLMYDTVAHGKHIFTACGVGKVAGDDAQLTDIGTATLEALMSYLEYHHMPQTVRLVEIFGLSTVDKRVRQALKDARDKEVVFFVCCDHRVYDAAFKVLRFRHIDGTRH